MSLECRFQRAQGHVDTQTHSIHRRLGVLNLRMRAPTPLSTSYLPCAWLLFLISPSSVDYQGVVGGWLPGWLFRKLIKLIQARHFFDGLSALIPTRIIDHNRNELYGIVRQCLCFGTILGCVSFILRAHIIVCPLALLSTLTMADKQKISKS